MLRRALLAVALVAAALPVAGATDTGAASRLPLGSPDLRETRDVRILAPGVTQTRIVRGTRSKADYFTVDVAFVPSREEARTLAKRLRADGYRPRVDTITERAPDDPEAGPLGYLVRVGQLASEAEAIALRDALAARGYAGLRVVDTAEDGGKTRGPWVVNVLEIDPDAFDGDVEARLGTSIVPGLEPLTGIAARANALAAVNGGYFVIGSADGTPGDLAGISVLDGDLVSEAVNGRTSLVLPLESGEGASIASLRTRQAVRAADGAERELDGLNRAPGLIRGCGGSGGDQPTELPKHDFTCLDASELVLYAPIFGEATPAGPGLEVVRDSSGVVTAVREPRGGPIPADGSVLGGTGEAAEWLRAHAGAGSAVAVSLGLSAEGAPLPVGEELAIVNGGPRLLREGAVEIRAAAEGFHWPERPEFYYRFGARRNPRTLAGVKADGTLVLVTVDGRRAGWSVGASFLESALIMRSLGAVDAVNLDGGGSTAMTVGASLVTRPSDPTGERAVGDALVLLTGS
jgi:hypothetical protein